MRVNYPKHTHGLHVISADTLSVAASKESGKRWKVLQKAASKNGNRVATDGLRIHREIGAGSPQDTEGYPDIEQNYPRSWSYECLVNADDLKLAARRAYVFARESNMRATITANGRIHVRAEDEELGTTETVVECASTNNEVIFGINADMLFDALKHTAPKGGLVWMKANDSTSPVIFESEDGARDALVMPMHLGD